MRIPFGTIVERTIVIILAISWTFSGWPQLFDGWQFTPRIERAQAITYTDTCSADGTWVAPSLTTEVTVEAWGAGGAGAGEAANTQYGQGGGGGGAYSGGPVTVIGGNSYTVVVGTGGTASNGAGGDGGDSYFNDTSTILAKGGTGGNGDTGGTGGQASAGV